jgi:hypothetical protein
MILPSVPKVAFNAYCSTGGNYGVGQSIVFPDVSLNEGGGYNESTGIFTAPEAGMYLFGVHVCHAIEKHMTAAIVHENTTIAITTGYENIARTCSSVMVPVRIQTGEQVYVKSTYTNVMSADKHRRPSFNGFLFNV